MATSRHHYRMCWLDRLCDDCHRPDRDPVHYTQVELDRGIDTDDLEQDQAIGDLRQRLDQADRNTAELRDLLVRSMRVTSRDEHGYCQYCRLQARGARHVHCWQCGQRQPGHASDCPVGAALDVAAPAATTETADE